jgi:hypothetical protein
LKTGFVELSCNFSLGCLLFAPSLYVRCNFFFSFQFIFFIILLWLCLMMQKKSLNFMCITYLPHFYDLFLLYRISCLYVSSFVISSTLIVRELLATFCSYEFLVAWLLYEDYIIIFIEMIGVYKNK